MNLPNKLTVARIGLTFVMAVCLTFPGGLPFGKTIALAIFVVASITDYWDGRLARRHNIVTAFGELMDPLADKILVSAAFISFVALPKIVPAWVVITIICREFLVTGLRLLAANRAKILPAGTIGKHKTLWQIIVIIVIMVGLALREDILPHLPPYAWVTALADGFPRYFRVVTYALSSLTAILTVVSGAMYMWVNREIFVNDL